MSEHTWPHGSAFEPGPRAESSGGRLSSRPSAQGRKIALVVAVEGRQDACSCGSVGRVSVGAHHERAAVGVAKLHGNVGRAEPQFEQVGGCSTVEQRT